MTLEKAWYPLILSQVCKKHLRQKSPQSRRFSLIPAENYDQDATADENLRTNEAANRLPRAAGCKGQMQMIC